jgi:hypothetical protein
MVKAIGSIKANQSAPKPNTSSCWPDGQCALERACYLRASRPKAHHQVADFCSAPMEGIYAAVDTSPITTTRTISPDQIIIPVLNLMGCAFPLCRKSLGRTQHFKLARFILPQRVRRRLSPLCPPMIAMRTNYEFSVVAPRAVFLVVQIYAWVKLCKTSTHKKQPLISLFNQPVQFNRQRPHK